MTTYNHQRAIGVFANLQNVEKSFRALEAAGFDMSRVSVIAQDIPSQSDVAGANVSNKANERASTGVIVGGTLGSVTGLLVGVGALAIPGIGSLVLAGEAMTIVSTLIGGTMGAATGKLIGILNGLGIPEERAKVYSDRVMRGYYLVTVVGTPNEMTLAERTLQNREIEEWGIYENPKS
ncbi:signal transduction histidine kinase (STHK), LytS [Leptolyngbya sp. AN02str]|uniref:signal transduction histidine kinase (STHK), LytS n=1 Tax=Leptolyngbya sp. AN02str TaxID=3423363 RepID=UPI003D3229E6